VWDRFVSANLFTYKIETIQVKYEIRVNKKRVMGDNEARLDPRRRQRLQPVGRFRLAAQRSLVRIQPPLPKKVKRHIALKYVPLSI
jgi:hypothetical protein